ncbi:MAG: Nucleotidyl transferase [Acidobacteria bacterium]|nr:Nucleotidyl transferase [Acidobacteriota bacterium]
MKAMILAAGYGTRLRPLTYTLPKPMVPVCNKPLISYAVDAFIDGGIRDIVVNLHHLPVPIESYLRTRYIRDAKLVFSYEREILGTGGGIRNVRAVLEGGELLLVNADTIQFPRWERLLEARRERDSLAALTLRHPPEGDRFTPVYYDHGLVTGFGRGSGNRTGEPLMFSGSHAISDRIFQWIPDKDFSGIVDEAYQPALDSGRETIAGVIDDGLWFDVGTPQRYLAASRELLRLIVDGKLAPPSGSTIDGDSLVHESAHGRLTRSCAGARTNVEGEVRDSILWDDCHIAAGVTLDSCIVAHGVDLAQPIELRNALICRDDPRIPRDSGYRFEQGLAISEL